MNSFQAEEASLAVAKREAMSDLKIFHWTGALEAISYLLLFFVAMPLKYLWQMPIFVRWVGLFHGIFFILFCALRSLEYVFDGVFCCTERPRPGLCRLFWPF